MNVSLAEVPFLAAATGTISLGNGAGDTVTAGGFVVAGTNDKITLGDGAGDVVTGGNGGRNNHP